MTHSLRITILHELPGRLRVRLSQPLPRPDSLSRLLRSHAGIEPAYYSAVTGTLLLHFDHTQIRREELLIRTALAFSLQCGNGPVRIETSRNNETLSPAVAISGLSLLVAATGGLIGLPPATRRRLEPLAATATAWAVATHAVQEFSQQRRYDPEVLSIAYLAVSMLRGNALRAAVLTWFTAFGRHLLETAAQAVEIRPQPDAAGVSVSAVAAPYWQTWLRLLPALLKMLAGAAGPGDDLIARVQDVSRLHDQVLDALGPWKDGIAIQFSAAGMPANPVRTSN